MTETLIVLAALAISIIAGLAAYHVSNRVPKRAPKHRKEKE